MPLRHNPDNMPKDVPGDGLGDVSRNELGDAFKKAFENFKVGDKFKIL